MRKSAYGAALMGGAGQQYLIAELPKLLNKGKRESYSEKVVFSGGKREGRRGSKCGSRGAYVE